MKALTILGLLFATHAMANQVTLPGKYLRVTDVAATSAAACVSGKDGKTPLTEADIAKIDSKAGKNGAKLSSHIRATNSQMAATSNWKGQNFLVAVILEREVLAVRNKASPTDPHTQIYLRDISGGLEADATYVSEYVGGEIWVTESFKQVSGLQETLTYEYKLFFKEAAVCTWTTNLTIE